MGVDIGEIKKYIDEWEYIDGVKPINDSTFMYNFMGFIKDSDIDQWNFSGENGYCGNTAKVQEHPSYVPLQGFGFEFAYGANFVKVFNANHSGFWVPEYIDLKGDESLVLLGIIKNKLLEWGGVM